MTHMFDWEFLWHSNAPWMKTGYGQQTAIWGTRLRDLFAPGKFVIAGYAGTVHAHVAWEGIPVLAASTQHQIGMDVLGYYYEKTRAKAVLSLCDAWALSPKLMALMNTYCWTPVDADAPSDERAVGEGLRDFFAESGAKAIGMSRYGQQAMRRAGIPAGYIPHGLPMDVWKPSGDRDRLRSDAGFGDGTFVAGINQANRSGLRKNLPGQIEAFWRFWKRHPDSKLLLHMSKNHKLGQDLPDLCNALGFPEGVVIWPDQGVYAAGEIEMEGMPAWYESLDITIGAAMAGGFELPLLESQSVGTPVIATDGSAMAEVAGPHSFLVPAQPFWVENTHAAFWDTPLTGHQCSACGHGEGIEWALEAAWQMREDDQAGWEALRKTSREHALQYDADKILAAYWIPFLKLVEAAL